jgi:hypothetical protein
MIIQMYNESCGPDTSGVTPLVRLCIANLSRVWFTVCSAIFGLVIAPFRMSFVRIFAFANIAVSTNSITAMDPTIDAIASA